MNTTEAISRASSNPPSRIRSALASDADGVFALLTELENNTPPERGVFDEIFHHYLTEKEWGPILLIAEDAADTVRGYALVTVTRLLYTEGASAQLQELVVDASAAGQGIGTLLVAAAERECQNRGVKQLTVASLRAAMFYERLGYRSTSDFLKRRFD